LDSIDEFGVRSGLRCREVLALLQPPWRHTPFLQIAISKMHSVDDLTICLVPSVLTPTVFQRTEMVN